jgi:hypothetical protein
MGALCATKTAAHNAIQILIILWKIQCVSANPAIHLGQGLAQRVILLCLGASTALRQPAVQYVILVLDFFSIHLIAIASAQPEHILASQP